MPIRIDGTDITGATIDGTDVTEITVDGDTVFTAAPEVPTAGLLHHWDFSQPNTSSTFCEDLVGSNDATGTISGLSTINGKQAGLFNSGFLQAPVTPFSSGRKIAMVLKLDTLNAGTQHIIDDDDQGVVLFSAGSPDKFRFFQGSSNQVLARNSDTNPHVAIVEIGSTDVITIDNDAPATASAGSNTMDNLRMGNARGGGQPMSGKIGEILFYDTSSAASNTDIKTYLSDSWSLGL